MEETLKALEEAYNSVNEVMSADDYRGSFAREFVQQSIDNIKAYIGENPATRIKRRLLSDASIAHSEIMLVYEVLSLRDLQKTIGNMIVDSTTDMRKIVANIENNQKHQELYQKSKEASENITFKLITMK